MFAVLKYFTKTPSKLPVNNQMLKPFLEMSLKEALTKKRIFIVDYEIMDGLLTKPSSIAFFYQHNDGTLIPIAIQLFQKLSNYFRSDNSVFLPSDPEYTWILAKMWFNGADANYHESVSLPEFTHLKMEGVVAITHLQIYIKNPIYKLLMPHFFYLLAINWTGIPLLLGNNGYIVKLLNIGRDGATELIRRKNKSWRLDVDVCLTLTSINFTCSAKHEAVTFRQYEEYAFPPNFSITLRGISQKPKTTERGETSATSSTRRNNVRQAGHNRHTEH
ncbi:polyunsaturated fatty acid 5-lipoxygenase-like [Ruditapes philippinarum]|uniref:polyunsaturated fatty acid 5-lipoxygenase-like n=1 Tax=Ruditapes philippinarum TaxID=129788 RepID=UPI00295A6933|nr:polyunsaturated fatty acid 5-lipoxygenase-like [Ruditapes philippinarum]